MVLFKMFRESFLRMGDCRLDIAFTVVIELSFV